jgi:hypothetical protein
VHVRLVPRDELAVLPDQLCLLHESVSMNEDSAAVFGAAAWVDCTIRWT